MNLTVPQIAAICHAANREYQFSTNDPVISPLWKDASKEMQASARHGVSQALTGASAEELHESWCDFKTKQGWVYGKFKDEVAKTHPCLVDYLELPETQRRKDFLFAAIVGALK